MNRLIVAACLIVLPLAGIAADEVNVAGERARIATERAAIEGEFKTSEKACYKTFAVNDCLNDARSRRRDALGHLRRQELAINDAERKRRAAERVREIEAKSSPEKAAEQARNRDQALVNDAARQERGKKKAGDHAALAASAPANAAARTARDEERRKSAAAAQASRIKEAADNVRRREEKLAEAARQKKDRDRRVAEHMKKPASGLPTPP